MNYEPGTNKYLYIKFGKKPTLINVKVFKTFTEGTFAVIAILILIASIALVFGQVSKVTARGISCRAFNTHYDAQVFYNQQKALKEAGQPYDHSYTRLDGDGNGIACESKV